VAHDVISPKLLFGLAERFLGPKKRMASSLDGRFCPGNSVAAWHGCNGLAAAHGEVSDRISGRSAMHHHAR
jgi:hypothetical protein